MMKNNNYIITAVVIIAIIFSIIFIEKAKVKPNENFLQKPDGAKQSKYPKAPELVGTQKWINSEPLKISDLKGKVVLIDFWTYTCINCIRTLPYLKEWDRKYRDKGIVIIGVHTPEFEFEKIYDNVLNAVQKYEIKYPVVQDNDYATWRAYRNRFWPHKYLIDSDGYIRYDHIGEGAYEETEKMIQLLLRERMEKEDKRLEITTNITKPQEAVDVNFLKVKTPEIYFGYEFSRGNFGNKEGLKPEGIIEYKIPETIIENNIYLEGKWKNNADNMELVSDDGRVVLKFHAKVLNIVAGSENGSTTLIFLEDNFVDDKNKGADVIIKDGKSVSSIRDFRLYNLVSTEGYDTHTIKIGVKGKGYKIYTFTFG